MDSAPRGEQARESPGGFQGGLDPRARPAVQHIPRYVAGDSPERVRRSLGLLSPVKLASNENPLGPSPLAVEALRAASTEVARYPEDDAWTLRQALAARLDVPPEWVAVGAGSSALLKLLAEAYLAPGDGVVYAWPSFILYPVVARLQEAREVAVPLDPEGRHDLDRMAQAAQQARLVVVCNPNNPTGTYVTRRDLERFLDQVPPEALVVLDEAYAEFARDAAGEDYPDGVAWVREGRRVAVLRSFSKVYGLAGLRVGYLVAAPEVVEAVSRVREPFQVSSPAQAAALAALQDQAHVERTLGVVAQGRRTLSQLAARWGLRAYPSVANFVWMDVGRPAEAVAQALLPLGVIVRPGPPGATWIRVSVGTPEEVAKFAEALEAVLKDAG
jgi:histidinol-phosphate aminotransferase